MRGGKQEETEEELCPLLIPLSPDSVPMSPDSVPMSWFWVPVKSTENETRLPKCVYTVWLLLIINRQGNCTEWSVGHLVASNSRWARTRSLLRTISVMSECSSLSTRHSSIFSTLFRAASAAYSAHPVSAKHRKMTNTTAIQHKVTESRFHGSNTAFVYSMPKHSLFAHSFSV